MSAGWNLEGASDNPRRGASDGGDTSVALGERDRTVKGMATWAFPPFPFFSRQEKKSAATPNSAAALAALFVSSAATVEEGALHLTQFPDTI